MKTIIITIGLLFLISLSGCLEYGDDEETTTPNPEQVNRCIAKMRLNPSIKMTPLGFKFDQSFLDNGIWFKFKTDTTDLSQVFDTTKVDVTKFKKDFDLLYPMKGSKWWDIKNKSFLGGQIALPNGRFMNIGIETLDDGYMIYIMWHET